MNEILGPGLHELLPDETRGDHGNHGDETGGAGRHGEEAITEASI